MGGNYSFELLNFFSGLAEIGGICKLNAPRALSVSINKEIGIYSSIQTAAHELGHKYEHLHLTPDVLRRQ